MRFIALMGAALMTLLSAAAVNAHHSFTATYDETEVVKLEGELLAFNFRNPHASVDIMVTDENGAKQRWGVEWGGAGQLASQGVTRESLKPGDHVIITGNPARNPLEHRIRMRSLLRPSDGYGWGFEGETFD